MNLTKRPKVAILTLHPLNGGGILSSLRSAYSFFSKYFDTTVFFLGFDSSISVSLRKPWRKNRVRHTTYFGMPCVEIGAKWAFWEPGHYKNTRKVWEQELEGYDYFFVTSGTALAAHPLVLLNKKFVLWVAAPFDDDRREWVRTMPLLRRCIDQCSVGKMREIEHEILKSATVLLPLSSYTNEYCQKACNRERTKICGYPIGLSTSQVSVSQVSASPVSSCKLAERQRDVEPRFIAVGRFTDPRKNLNMLMQVFQLIWCSNSRAQLCIVGSVPSDFAADWNMLPWFVNVEIVGYASNEQLDRLYSSCDVMLISSYQEGLGIVGLEALAHGVPVVATDCGGVRDYVINGKTGFLVPIDDIQEMADKALEIVKNKENFERMSSESRSFVEQNFSHKRIENIFEQAMITAYPEIKNHFEQAEGVNHEASCDWTHVHSSN